MTDPIPTFQAGALSNYASDTVINNQVQKPPQHLGTPSSRPPAPRHPRNVYVASLPNYFTEQLLREEFEKFGPIFRTKMGARKSATADAFGFVYFVNEDSATEAVKHARKEISGCRIQVRHAEFTKGTESIDQEFEDYLRGLERKARLFNYPDAPEQGTTPPGTDPYPATRRMSPGDATSGASSTLTPVSTHQGLWSQPPPPTQHPTPGAVPVMYAPASPSAPTAQHAVPIMLPNGQVLQPVQAPPMMMYPPQQPGAMPVYMAMPQQPTSGASAYQPQPTMMVPVHPGHQPVYFMQAPPQQQQPTAPTIASSHQPPAGEAPETTAPSPPPASEQN